MTNIFHTVSIRKPSTALLALFLALVHPLLPVGPGFGALRGASLEYQLKAAFLLNFTRYVEWPQKSGDLSICVLGPDVFGNALQDVVAGKVVNGRKIVVRGSVSQAEAANCNVVYISLEGARQIRESLKALGSSAVLTVGEDADFVRMGGIIAFAPQDGKLRFYINGSAAAQADFVISSRLMALAKSLRDDGERRR